MGEQNSVDIVHAFWDAVWNAHDPAAADRFVTDAKISRPGSRASWRS